MWKKILISTGVTIILLLLAVWMYLLLFGTPRDLQDTFVNLGLQNGPTEIEPVDSREVQQINTSKQLQPLTLNPVAGFVLIERQASTTSAQGKLRYAERGTGHIYEINLGDAEARRVSNFTLVKTQSATFSKDGNRVVLTSDDTTVLVRPGATGESTSPLPDGSQDFSWTEAGELVYFLPTENGGESYLVNDGVTSLRWRIPFSDVNSFTFPDRDIIVNRPSSRLAGGAYEVETGGQLQKLAGTEFSFDAKLNDTGDKMIYTWYDNDLKQFQSVVRDLLSEETLFAQTVMLPEKCSFESIITSSSTSAIWCAVPLELSGSSDKRLVDDWRKGKVSFADLLISFNAGETKLVADLSELAGFDVDVTDLTVSADGKTLFFRNKINDTLWMYKIEG